jgi:hypothetical protein
MILLREWCIFIEATNKPSGMRYLPGFLLFFLLVSCDPNVLFREPQPPGSKDYTKFPASLRGTYVETVDDSSVYVVTSTYIFQQYEEELDLPVAEMMEDDEVTLIGDTLILKDMDLVFPVIVKNDSIFGTITFYDTIFDLSAGYKLRKLQKNYFLNFPHDSMWTVLKLQFRKGGRAYLFDINVDQEAEIFKEHSEVEIIRNDKGKPETFIMNPSRNELKILLMHETFTDTTEFIRISE